MKRYEFDTGAVVTITKKREISKESKFFLTLEKYYEKIKGTRFKCKFFAQVGTFSFELHDSTKLCFSQDSFVYESEVYYSWINHNPTQNQILKDIRTKAKELENGIKI